MVYIIGYYYLLFVYIIRIYSYFACKNLKDKDHRDRGPGHGTRTRTRPDQGKGLNPAQDPKEIVPDSHRPRPRPRPET